MPTPFPQQLAAVSSEVPQKFRAFHTAMEASSKPSPAALIARFFPEILHVLRI
jgi:hypothetical protein